MSREPLNTGSHFLRRSDRVIKEEQDANGNTILVISYETEEGDGTNE